MSSNLTAIEKQVKIKQEHFTEDESEEGDILESLPCLATAKEEEEFMHQLFNGSIYIDQNTDVKPLIFQHASQVQTLQAQPGSSYGTVKTDKGANSGPTGMDDDETIPKAPETDNGAHCGLICEPTEMDEDDYEPYWPLSGKPYFHVILSKSQATYPYILGIPSKIVSELPSASVPVIITYCGKRWEMVYLGHLKLKRLDSGWAKFVIDNKLKREDGCFFELTDNSPTRIMFRAQILRCPGLSDTFGSTSEAPIIID